MVWNNFVQNKFQMIRLGHVARMGDRRGTYRDKVWRPDGKRPLGSPRHRWEDNIKMDLHDVGWFGMG